MNKTVTITVKEYTKLKEDARILQALYDAGVDNWEWFDDALNSLDEGDLL